MTLERHATRLGDAWVSGPVQEGVLASSEVFGDTRPFWVIDRRWPNIEPGEAIRGAPEALYVYRLAVIV